MWSVEGSANAWWSNLIQGCSDCEGVSHSVMSGSLWPMDYSPPGSSVHWILQTRILEWVAISFPRGSFQPRDGTWIFEGRFFTAWAIREVHPGSVHYKYWDSEKLGQFSTDEISMNAAFNLWDIVVSSRLYLLMSLKSAFILCCQLRAKPHTSGISWPLIRKTRQIEFHI